MLIFLSSVEFLYDEGLVLAYPKPLAEMDWNNLGPKIENNDEYYLQRARDRLEKRKEENRLEQEARERQLYPWGC